MSHLILYYQPDCHLCDDAEILMHAAGLGDCYQKIDIETDLELLKRYGIHVPVLMHRDKQTELFWPFDALEVAELLGSEILA